MESKTDPTKSLEQLEGVSWGQPEFNSTLVVRCHELRKKPLREMTAEDLRVLVGQGIGLDFLAPLALDLLDTDPLVAGDLYRGDLLAAVIRIDERFWSSHEDLYWALREVLVEVKTIAEFLADEQDRVTTLLELNV